MKVNLPFTCSLLILLFALNGSAQTVPSDSDPVMQGSTTYAMPQLAIDAEIDGAVVVGIQLDDTGKPTKVGLISGPVWPCGAMPIRALEELSSTLSETMMKVRFSPAIKSGKPVSSYTGLTLKLKNPNLEPKPAATDPATGQPIPKLVRGGVLNGKASYLAKPSYPASARANRDKGGVTIHILINEEGTVIRAGAVDGAQTLQFAAREAACNSKFSPTLLAGHPVKVAGSITYNFRP